jgi:beta-N-acetylhexosaminidase
VPMVMTAHILFPKIDPDNVATVSKIILNDLLRGEMGFKGVVIADALGMKAIHGTLSQREIVVKAINASLDIFMVAGDTLSIKDALAMATLMQEALQKGEIKEETLQAAEKRIDKFIDALPQYPVTQLDTATLDAHHALASELESQKPLSDFELSLPSFE